jgi:hypothetical protein
MRNDSPGLDTCIPGLDMYPLLVLVLVCKDTTLCLILTNEYKQYCLYALVPYVVTFAFFVFGCVPS